MKVEKIPVSSVNKFLPELSVPTAGKVGTGKKIVINERPKKDQEWEHLAQRILPF